MNFIKKYWIIILIVVSVFIHPGITFIIFGAYFAFTHIQSLIFLIKNNKKWIECIGCVLDMKRVGNGRTPIIHYTTINDISVKEQPKIYFISDLGKNIRKYKDFINQEVVILYSPHKPKEFIIKSDWEINYLFTIIAAIIGLAFLSIGLSNFLGYIKLN